MSTYADLRSGPLLRSFIAGPFGVGWQKAMGAAMDLEMNRSLWARRARWPQWCPSDGLVWLGVERQLERVITMGTLAPEDEGRYRGRLVNSWYIWQEGGSQQIHVDAFRWCGLTNVSVHRRKEWCYPDDASCPSPYVVAFQHSVWAQFDLLIDQPHPWKPVLWGDGHLWGGNWTWGSSATPAEIAQLKRLALKFRAGHDTPMWLVLNLGTGRVWGGGWKWGDGGLWGSGKYGSVRWLVGEPHWKTRGLAP